MDMNTFSLDSLSVFEEIIRPAFADLIPGDNPLRPGTLQEFTLMDDVVRPRAIVDIRRLQNILQRRDASCDLNYKKVMNTTTRTISTEPIYGATSLCRNEFYQGALEDLRAGDPIFEEKILPIFKGAMKIDITSNAYFGDRTRDPLVNWSVHVFDGVFTWMKKYIATQAIPTNQTIQIPDNQDLESAAGATYAYNLIKTMYQRRNVLMKSLMEDQQAYYVSRAIADAYEEFLITSGLTAQGYTILTSNIRTLAYKGIPILVEPIWDPVLYELKGNAPAYAAVLTVRGNFVFAWDKSYGEGPAGHDTLEIFYDWKDMRWYWRMFATAGTQIALPEFVVVALTNFN